MDYRFEETAFVCVNIAGKPSVSEITPGVVLSTTHPVTEHGSLEDAVACAREIDPNFEYDDPTWSGE